MINRCKIYHPDCHKPTAAVYLMGRVFVVLQTAASPADADYQAHAAVTRWNCHPASWVCEVTEGYVVNQTHLPPNPLQCSINLTLITVACHVNRATRMKQGCFLPFSLKITTETSVINCPLPHYASHNIVYFQVHTDYNQLLFYVATRIAIFCKMFFHATHS